MLTKVCCRCHETKILVAFCKSGKSSRHKFKRYPVCRACRKEQDRQIKLIVFGWYGGCCRCCQESNLDFLTLDHLLDDGKSNRKRGTGSSLYGFLFRCGQKKMPSDLQILCWNCQWGKKINHGFCLHHPEIDLKEKHT